MGWEAMKIKKIKKSKKTVLLIILILLLFLAAVCTGILIHRLAQKHDIVRCTEDYSKIYKDQLQTIFGDGYTIGEKETIVIEGEDCSCGYHSASYEYNEWEISYKDQNGQTFTQTLNNTTSLEAQQLSWLRSQLEQYYMQKYVSDFFEEGTFQDLSIGERHGRTYCSVIIGCPVGSYTSDKKEEFDRIQKAGKIYKEQLLEQLREEENLLRLQEVDYDNIFNRFPVEVRFHLSIDDEMLSGAEKEKHERAVQERAEEMIQAIRQETNDACNLRIQICSANGHCDLYDGSRDWRYFILQGKQIKPENTFDGLEWEIFYAYEGIYW